MNSIDGASGWRPQLLRALLRWVTWLGGLAILVVVLRVGATPSRLVEPTWVAIYTAYVTLLVLHRAELLGYRTRAQLFVVLLLVTVGFVRTMVDEPSIAMLTGALAVLCSRLLLGRVALLLTWAGSTAAFAVLNAFDPVHTVAYGGMTGAMALLLHTALHRLQDTAERAERVAAELRVEQERRLRTQAELADTEQALFRAQKLEAVGRLAAGVGHDFNNALQVILSWTALLQEEAEDAELREGLQAIERAAAQGRELTSRLLTFGRREARSPAVLAPTRVVEELATSMRRLLPADIELALELHDTPPIWADPAQLDQVLLNLGLNARDAMPDGGTLVLGTRALTRAELPPHLVADASADVWVDLWVRDTGLGMDPETMARIFEPFFTTKGTQGTGLGLSTAYAILRQNRGHITVESRVHEGSTFHVYLPESAQTDLASAVGSPVSAASDGLVMVAEDEPLVRVSMSRILRGAGLEVVEAEDVPSSLRQIEQCTRRIDVLCTDGVMPGGETRSIIEAFRKRWPHGRVIVCSGYVHEDLLRRAIDAGEFEYLAKPFPPQVLLTRIQGLLQASHGDTGARRGSAIVADEVRRAAVP